MALNAQQILDQVTGKSIRTIRSTCFEASRAMEPKQAFALAEALFPNPDPFGAMAATMLAGHVSYLLPEALRFLKEKSATHEDSRVHDCLARALDHYLLNRGYDRAVGVMQEWARDANENCRKAVAEAPRAWGQKEYFKANPEAAFAFLGAMKADNSPAVRFSVGRALAELGQDFPAQLVAELKTWPLSQAEIKNTYMFASKNVHTQMGTLYTKPDK